MKFRNLLFAFLLFSFNDFFAQDDRYQLPVSLQKSYFEVNVGAIDYNFSDMLKRYCSLQKYI